VCINGAAAHLVKKGDQVILMAFGIGDEAGTPKQILVDEQNRYVRDIALEERGVIELQPR
ncbi:MAG: aspartate 1-decarboxylase, partial [Planctomycetota bacterium]|nr:aspartate 1-decarboxylase [Planctomycetota bacterium]